LASLRRSVTPQRESKVCSSQERIGEPPHGGGVLGLLIEEPEALILDDVSSHPRSQGFPEGHPVMKSFLGVPVKIRGEAWGNLYLTEKREGSFDPTDIQSVTILAEWIAIAIDNARSAEAERVRLTIEAAEQERGRWARELHDNSIKVNRMIRLMAPRCLGHRSVLVEDSPPKQ